MKKITIILLLLISTKIYSQTEYYTSDGKNILTKAELDKISEEIKTKYTKIMNKEIFVSFVIKETMKKNDSIIHKITFDIKDKKTYDNFKKGTLNQLKNKEFSKFNIKTLLGENFDSEKLKGKPTMINFWFTKCAPCIDEMPVLNEIAEKYKDDFNFIAITYESKENVEQFLTKHPFNFEHLINAEKFTNELGINTYPRNLFLDSNNILRFIENGITYVEDENGELIMGSGDEFVKILEKLK